MAISTAQIMRKGKRGAAAYIHADCVSGSSEALGPLLDVLLNPRKTIEDWESTDWCRWLIAGGRTPDEFATVVRSYDKNDKCGLVWIPRVVAYRCRTCGISPCMSICRECFHRGDHSTHDFNMFLSQAGGACDCGDKSVMKEDGFCSYHGKCPRPSDVPAELMCVAEAVMPRLILRLLQHFRENSYGSTNSESYRTAVQECEFYVQMLMDFNNMGDLMRTAMTKALINPEMYRELVEPPFANTDYGRYMAESHKVYESAIDNFPAPEPPDEYRHLPALANKLQHNTLLDEFIFWTFKYEFPQNVVCFLLNMLPDQDYKEHLTRTFVMHYARIPLVLEAAADPDTLSNRVVHMSVQLFSNEALALRCVQELHLLYVMVISLRLMMGKILMKNTLHDPAKNTHQVIDCAQRVMKEHCYWPLVSDFNNVLSHKSVALVFLQDDALVNMWFEFLSMLQGMNVNVRELGTHIEFEPSSYYAAFACELEAAAYPMWSVLAHLTEPAHATLAKRMVAAALGYLQAWLDAVGCGAPGTHRAEIMHASFHLPLHRYLGAFLCCLERNLRVPARDVLPPPSLLALLAAHPLRAQSLFYEILAGVWVRNGLQIKGQAMTYIQANFCNSMVDMDIYLLQICAAHLPQDQFLNMCIDMFGCRELLNMTPMSAAQTAEQEAMLEGLLTFLAILVSSRTNLGNDELTQSRLEVSTLLAAGDRTHSQLLELMPERSGNAHTRNFETVLKELSTYRAPPKGSENLEQGLFVPKPLVWERYYDPLHMLRRAIHRRDFHASMERFTAFVHERNKATGKNSAASGPLWPPLRLAAPPPGASDPRLLCASGVLHAALLSVLHRGVHRRGADASPDHVLALCVHLLLQAATLQAERQTQCSVCPTGSGWSSSARAPLLRSFPAGAVCDNARRLVRSVAAPRRAAPPPPPAPYHSDSDNDWDPPEPGPARPDALVAGAGTALAVPRALQVARGDSVSDDQSDTWGDDSQMRALEGVHAEGDNQVLALPSAESQEEVMDTADRQLAFMLEYERASPSGWELSRVSPEQEQQSDDQQMQIEVHHSEEDSQYIPVNESIISLLLKLHSQLSGRLDSFSLDEPAPDTDDAIGDGPFFIGQVLRKLAELDARCAVAIEQVRASLWPHQRERQAEQAARERQEKEERSRRARDRQQQLMREFQMRQQAFLSSMTRQDAHVREPGSQRHYTCVICNTTAPTEPAEPHALVVLLQSTSVLGHRRRAGGAAPMLALSEAERARLAAQRETAAASVHYRLHDELQQHFAEESWLLSVNVGWEGGVHVQTCGHHLHLNCLQSYLRSLSAPQRPNNLHVDRGEFLCPVCRQLANSVLPLAPAPPPPPAPAAPATPAALAAQIHAMLRAEHPAAPPSRLSQAMGKAMEDMTATAGTKLRQRYGSSPAAIFTFVASLVRTNLECELVQRGGSLCAEPAPRYKPRNECIVPLLEVAGTYARVLRSATHAAFGAADTWAELAPVAPHAEPTDSAGTMVGTTEAGGRRVPLMLRDPLALLLQFLLLAPPDPPHLDLEHFTCIVRSLYALNYYQIVCQFLANMSAEARAALARSERGERGLCAAARAALCALRGSELFAEDGVPRAPGAEPDVPALEGQLQELLLPFVRAAALLRHQIYSEELPDATPDQEFVRLCYYLELCTHGMEWSEWSAAQALPEQSAALAAVASLGRTAARHQLATRRVLSSLHCAWAQPALLALPRDYDRLFSYYHERVCLQCGAVPKEAALCLLCGTLVCLKQPCCRTRQVAEAVQHAQDCGGGTGIFLVVTSTYIIVIRGRRACVWGSLYLDDYDEEDRDLKRGKPLYLSQDRLELLQAQWLAHRFDHTKRTWVWHRDML